MSGGAITALVVIVVILVLVVLAAAILVPRMRRRRLQERFGPEYDRTVESVDSRREAEQQLTEREKRHAKLDLHDVPPEIRDRYARDWRGVQERFVDTPGTAVGEADRLVTALMAERGYPTEGYEQQLTDLSVEHADTLDHYRSAHAIVELQSRQEATTEDLRLAMVHYRVLFTDLLGGDRDLSVTGDSSRGAQPEDVRDNGSDEVTTRDREDLRDDLPDEGRAGVPADERTDGVSPAAAQPVDADESLRDQKSAPRRRH